jgi:excisionase family DNA binding protein
MEMLGYGEAAGLIGVPRGTLYAWVHDHRIPHVRLGARLVRFRRKELEAWLSERHVPEVRAAGRKR